MNKSNIYKTVFICIPIYLLIIALLTGYPLFETNDDVYIMDVLSGNITGEPYAVTSYFHVFLGFVISNLYRLAYIPWFPIFIISCNMMGQIALYSALYEMFCSREKILPSILLIFFLPISIYLTFLPTYTTSATLIGLSAIYMLYKEKLGLSMLCLALATAIRMQSGFVVCAFWGISYIYLHFLNNKKITWDFLIKGVLVLAIVFAVYASDEIIKDHIEPSGYAKFRNAQTVHNDFGVRNQTVEEEQAMLYSIGWDKNLYELSRIYFSMDERITADDFIEMNKYSNYNKFSLNDSIAHLIMRAKDSYNIMHIMLFLGIAFAAFMVYAIPYKNNGIYLAILAILFALAGMLRLAQVHRVIARSMLSIALPCSIVLISLFNNLPHKERAAYGKLSYIGDAVFALLCVYAFLSSRYLIGTLIALVYVFFFSRRKLKTALYSTLLVLALINPFAYVYAGVKSIQGTYADDILNAKTIAELRAKIEDYAFKHEDNIYIIGSNLSGDSRMIKPQRPLDHILSWGGTTVHSSAHSMQLNRIGVNNYDSSILLQDNVYFLSLKFDENDTLPIMLKENLKNKGYNTDFKLVDSTDYMKVFKFNSI